MAPFTLLPPTVAAVPLVCDSPHSGTTYPDDYRHAVARELLRRGEDTHVEALWQAVPAVGGTLLAAHFPRTYIDANRTEDDLDAALLAAGRRERRHSANWGGSRRISTIPRTRGAPRRRTGCRSGRRCS